MQNNNFDAEVHTKEIKRLEDNGYEFKVSASGYKVSYKGGLYQRRWYQQE